MSSSRTISGESTQRDSPPCLRQYFRAVVAHCAWDIKWKRVITQMYLRCNFIVLSSPYCRVVAFGVCYVRPCHVLTLLLLYAACGSMQVSPPLLLSALCVSAMCYVEWRLFVYIASLLLICCCCSFYFASTVHLRVCLLLLASSCVLSSLNALYII